ncbi:hypothetical protein [Streptomyces sp. NPDC093225]|uniref:hypothetical protein n=1 Tax=Streptomyces sp. NPDC093225 TaxID=3366034 RepID=UPI00381D9A30
MHSTRNVMGAIALIAALSGALSACGPVADEGADGAPTADATAPADTGAPADPSAKPTDGGGTDGGENDCGKPPTLPPGVKMIEVGLHRDASQIEAFEAKPKCTPNDYIYHGEGQPKGYVLPADVKGELALGPGQHKKVGRDELSKHIDGCLREDYNVVKQPFSCYGNVYEITLDAKGEIATMSERWSV